MGVEGLWEAVNDFKQTVPLAAFRGKKIAVDAPNIIHQAARAFCLPLVHGDLQPVIRNVEKKLSGLEKRFGVQFVLVFDGEDPPVKAEESASRERERLKYRGLGLELLKCGRMDLAEALFRKAPPVGRYVENFVAAFRQLRREVILAPCEAEAQLAFLSRSGAVAAIWTGDSDVIAYFAGQTIRDIDIKRGSCDVYDFRNSAKWPSVGPLGQLQRAELFCLACAIAGCDYTPFHRNINVVARQIVELGPTTVTFSDALSSLAKTHRLNASQTTVVRQAVFTYLHHWVWDPVLRGGDVVMNFPLNPTDVGGSANAVLPDVETSVVGGVADMQLLESVLGPRKPFMPTPAVALIDEGVDLFQLPTDEQREAIAATVARDDRKKACLQCAIICDSPAMFADHVRGVWHLAVSAVVDAHSGTGGGSATASHVGSRGRGGRGGPRRQQRGGGGR
jgi:hypothetical protein